MQGADYDYARADHHGLGQAHLPVSEADFYFCGPKGFMRLLDLGLRALDVPDERIHFEFFGPAQDLLYA